MKELEQISHATYAMWHTDRDLAELVTLLTNRSNSSYRTLPVAWLNDIRQNLLRLANNDIPAFINKCMVKQNDILAQANRIYDLIDEEDEDGK